jgi:uncharacterized protein (DUF4415 family)
MAIVRYTTEQLKKMKSLTDLERIRNMKDKDIDFSDTPEITAEQIKTAKRFGRPLKQDKKQAISIRLPKVTIEKLRASGKNWQTRLSKKISQWATKGL